MQDTNLCDCDMIHPRAVKRALRHRPKSGQITSLAELFKILSDPTRLQILWALDRNELCVCDIANVLNMTKSAVSHQLSTLRNSGIVKSRRAGREVYYVLDDRHVTQLYELGLAHIKERK